MQKIMSALLSATLLLSATAAFAQQPTQTPPTYEREGRQYGRKGPGKMGALSRLNLSEAQRTQVQQIMASEKERNSALYSQMRELRTEMRAAREADDTAKLDNLRSQMMALRPQLQQARQATKQQVETVLTPEQRDQLRQIESEKQSRRQGSRMPI